MSTFKLTAWTSDLRRFPTMVPLGLKDAEVPVVYSDPVIQLVFSNLPPYLRQKNILTYMVC